MRAARLSIAVVAAVAVASVDLGAPAPGADGRAGIELRLGTPALAKGKVKAFFRRLGRRIKRGFRRFGQKVKKGFKKFGKKVKKGFKKFGQKVKKGFKKVGKAIKKGFKKVGKFFKKIGKGIKKWFGKIKNKIVKGFKKFVKKITDFIKRKIFDPIVNKIIGKIADKLHLGIDDLERILDKKTGKINMNEIGKVLIARLGDWVKPWLEAKVGSLLRKGFSFIRPYLDTAVNAIVGALGSIPFAGGAIAAVVSAGYSWGIEKLLDWASGKLVGLVWKWGSKLLSKGWNWLAKKIAPLRRLVERVTKSALKLYGYMKKGQAFLQKASR